MAPRLTSRCRSLLRRCLDAIADRQPVDARAAAAEIAVLGSDVDRIVAARVLFVLRDYQGALDVVDAPRPELMSWRYSMLKRLRFDVEAGEVLAALLEHHPGPKVTKAAVHYFRTTSQPTEALVHAEALARRSRQSAVDCIQLAVAAHDIPAARTAAARSLSRDPAIFGMVSDLLVEAGAYDEVQRYAAERADARAAVAQLELFAGKWADALSAADAVLADLPHDSLAIEVGFGAAVLGRQTARAHELYAATSAPTPTMLVWRAELALAEGDQPTAEALLDRARTAVPDYLAAKLLWAQATPSDHDYPVGSREGLLEGQLAALGAPPTVVDNKVSSAELQRCVAIATGNLAGNRTPFPSVLVDGGLQRVWPPRSSRHRARELQHRAAYLGIDRAIALVDEHVEPDNPTALCYRGELDLWAGRYADAAATFERCLALRKRTVWAWIGLGAALTAMGSAADGLARIDEGVDVLGWRGATVPVYRAEALYHLGRHDDALTELDDADAANPRRIASKVLRVLCLAAAGKPADDAFAVVANAAPALVADAARAVNIAPWWPRQLTGEPCVAVARSALALMRGNRSSGCAFWFAPDSDTVRAFIAERSAASSDADRDELAALERLL